MRVVVAALAALLLIASRPPAASGAGEVRRLFARAAVRVVTNDDAALADTLLEEGAPGGRRVVSVEEWVRTPEAERGAVTLFLINRERLPGYRRVPQGCEAAGEDLWVEAVRRGREIVALIVSAPDAAWLRQAVIELRQAKELPRNVQRRAVRSLAVIPVGSAAAQAAQPLLASNAHLVPAEQYERLRERMAAMDELILIDRSVPAPSEALASVGAAHEAGRLETLAWRERKPGGRWRSVISAPTAGQLAAALSRSLDLRTLPEAPTVLATSRDLRAVRRIAVSGIGRDADATALARQLAGRFATGLRALDAFEVLERAGLSEVLAEVALSQAGITRGPDRLRVRQLAAADALLIVELSRCAGKSDYLGRFERITPRLGPPPRRPLEPSRLKYTIAIPGKEDDPVVQGLVDSLLARSVGTRSRREYEEALDYYRERTLPLWQRQLAEYNAQRRSRPVSWRQEVTVRGEVSLEGSLRLVDMDDGLVLWEAPIRAAERGDASGGTRTLTTFGEDSSPEGSDVPGAIDRAPEELLARAVDAALAQGLAALRGTALLPAAGGVSAGQEILSGKVLDVDGETALVGLGAGDGVVVGDRLIALLEGGGALTLQVTRVRPRTCDAVIAAGTSADARARLTVGIRAERRP